ncbi:Uncharacterized protein FWK35_00008144 [Aphis craccivora]|uniref:Uncharacterized protein n=1 Tax=Aphis craccivora TaxID=307492 RepID=A0A6G0YZN2_APHCR|nr:Uncharacterized protein FWK35_00008144 [Aphis craccivora]
MPGSIGDMAVVYKKKNFTYVPSTPPAELIDSTSYILDLVARKFLNVELDPTDEFNAITHISLTVNILSFILDTPEKYKRNLFLETDNISLSRMVYQGENVLVVASKTKAGCRYLEWCIFETVVRKSTIIRPVVIKQFEIISNHLDQEFTNVKSPPKTNKEMIIFIKNLIDDKILAPLLKKA